MKAKNDLKDLLTGGKDYQILNSVGDRYFVECDNGDRLWIDKDLFDGDLLYELNKRERERIRDIVAEQVRNSCLPGGDIFKSMRGEMTVGIQDLVIEKSVDSVIENARFNALINSEPNEYVKVLEQLREVLRVPEGENIVTHAKVVRALADALIGLQK